MGPPPTFVTAAPQSCLQQGPRLKSPALIASLPDMGNVGGIAPRYLVEKLRAKKFAELIILERPWVQYRRGVVRVPKPTYSAYYHAPSDLIIFTGETQPESPQTLYELCSTVLDIAGLVAPLRRVYTIGGSESEKEELLSTVCACATSPLLIPELRNHKGSLAGWEGGGDNMVQLSDPSCWR